MNEQMYGNAWHCAGGGKGGWIFTKEFLCFILFFFFFFPLRRRHDSKEVMDIINKSANKARRGEDTTQKKQKKKSPRRAPNLRNMEAGAGWMDGWIDYSKRGEGGEGNYLFSFFWPLFPPPPLSMLSFCFQGRKELHVF